MIFGRRKREGRGGREREGERDKGVASAAEQALPVQSVHAEVEGLALGTGYLGARR